MQTKENHVTCQSGRSSQPTGQSGWHTVYHILSYTVRNKSYPLNRSLQLASHTGAAGFDGTHVLLARWQAGNHHESRTFLMPGIKVSLMSSMRPNVCFLISSAKWAKEHWKLNVIYQTQFITILQFARFFQPWTFWAKEFFPSASLISHMVQHPGWGPPSALQPSN